MNWIDEVSKIATVCDTQNYRGFETYSGYYARCIDCGVVKKITRNKFLMMERYDEQSSTN